MLLFIFIEVDILGKVSKALEKASSEAFRVPSTSMSKQKKTPNFFQKTQPTLSPATEHFHEESPQKTINKQWDERLLLTTSEETQYADIFKRLRSKILHPAEGPPPRKILITSAVPTEGKGFVSANLGIALARGMGQHALIVDCDMRKPALGDMFGIQNDYGLADYLKKNIDLTHIIQKTDLPKLSIIPGGMRPSNPTELLDSQKMVKLISELTNRYHDRYILLDTPPNLIASETAILSKYVDGVVIVVRWGGSDREQVKKLVDAIEKNKIIGIVFNAYEKNTMENYLTNRNEYEYYQKYYR